MKDFFSKNLFNIVLITAIIARFWDLFHIPFTYDELSTIFRIDGNWEEIKFKITADNHPPGHHLIALGLKSLFGLHPWILKLPFILAGIGSLVLIYRIGKDWVSETTGILSMALLALSQFHVMHSQIARPYALGQFFILLFVFVLGRVILKKLNFRWQDYALLLVCIVGAAYLHYIALLVISILWILSLFAFKEIRSQKIFLFLPIAAILFCLPMLSIFLEQWTHKGLSSIMATPDLKLVANHFYRVVNFSWFFALAIVVLTIYGWASNKQSISRKKLFFLFAFLIPLSILWVYSIIRSPLLSDRSLFFSLPFIVLFIFSFDLKKFLLPVNLLVLILCSYSLIFERQHYTIFYHQGFEDVAKNLSEDLSDSVTKDKTLRVINYNPDTYKPIKKQYPVFEKLEHLNPDSAFTFNDYADYINQEGTEQLIYANTAEFYAAPLEIIPLIEETFPYRETQKNYFLSHYYLFNKKQDTHKNYSLSYQPNFNDLLVFKDGSQRGYDYAGKEYGFELNSPLNEMVSNSSDYLFYKIMYRSEQPVEARMILELRDGENRIYWKSNRLVDYQITNGKNVFTSFLAIDLSDVNVNQENLSLKAYVWNLQKEDFYVYNAEVWSENGNPYKYSLIQDF